MPEFGTPEDWISPFEVLDEDEAEPLTEGSRRTILKHVIRRLNEAGNPADVVVAYRTLARRQDDYNGLLMLSNMYLGWF